MSKRTGYWWKRISGRLRGAVSLRETDPFGQRQGDSRIPVTDPRHDAGQFDDHLAMAQLRQLTDEAVEFSLQLLG
jgi:hypothetical protein